MRCPNCGWENPDNNAKCEKCNTPLSAGGAAPTANSFVGETVSDSDYPRGGAHKTSPTIPDAPEPTLVPQPTPEPAPTKPTKPAATFSKTVNAWMGGGPVMVARCKLTPIPMPGENPKYIPGEALFKGERNELNRENLDPDNMTITSKVQAELTHKEDGWYIEDKSSQHTTLIQITSPTKLKDGDIILMGNRMFVFSEE